MAQQLELLDEKGKAKGHVELNDELFAQEANEHLLYLAAVRQEANARAGTAHTKTRSEVRGGGAKPWRQKGTGRARAGSIRSPLWVGGGIIHGPRKNVNWTKGMNRKERKLAVLSAMIQALKTEKLSAIEAITVKEGKTKEFATLVSNLKLTETKTLFVVDAEASDLNLVERAAKNIPLVKVITNNNLNVGDLVQAEKVVFTKTAIEATQERFLENNLVKEAA